MCFTASRMLYTTAGIPFFTAVDSCSRNASRGASEPCGMEVELGMLLCALHIIIVLNVGNTVVVVETAN